MKEFRNYEEVVAFWTKKKGYVPRHMLLLVRTNKHKLSSKFTSRQKLYKQFKSKINMKFLKKAQTLKKENLTVKSLSKRREKLSQRVKKLPVEIDLNSSYHPNCDENDHDCLTPMKACVDDDFIIPVQVRRKIKLLQNKDGFCYLRLFDKIEDKITVKKLGPYPNFKQLREFRNMINLQKKIIYSNSYLNSLLYHVENSTSSKFNFMTLEKIFLRDESQILIGSKGLNPKLIHSEVNFNEEGDFDFFVELNDTYGRDGNYFKLVNNNFEIENVKIDFNNPNFPHDCVFYCLFNTFESGSRLKMLTPDYVDDEYIVEVTTSVISSHEVLLSKMNEKKLKYDTIKGSRKLLIIVVSFDGLMSNYKLSEPLICSLCTNYLNVKRLQNELLLSGKSYWVKTKEANFNRKFSDLVNNYTPLLNYESNKKPFDLIDQVWDKFDFMSSLQTINDELIGKVTQMSSSLNFIEKDNCAIELPIEGKMSLKRVTVVPMFCPKKRISSELINVEGLELELCKSKFNIISSGIVTQDTQDAFATPITKYEILSNYHEQNSEVKKEKKGYQFKPDFTQPELLELNLDGVMAKEAKNNVEVKEKRLESKIPFSSLVDTSDIEEFHSNFESFLENEVDYNPSDQTHLLMKLANSCIKDANINLMDQGDMLVREFSRENKSLLYNWLNFVSDLMFEINLSLRENTKNGFFIVKCLKRYNADVYIKTTNSSSHIFFFVVCENDYVLSQTIGPKFIKKDNIIVCEWGSMLKRDLENFLNIKETIRSTYVCYDEIFADNHAKQKLSAKWLSLMILLNNKDRNEEILTSLRYTYMKALSLTDNSCTMNKKLSLLFRDRLQVYLTKKVFSLNDKMSKTKPKITFVNGQLETNGLLDLFDNELTFKEAINLSYSGYIMTKVKQPQSNQASKMIEKILAFEIKSLNLTNEEVSINSLCQEKTHCFDYKYVRTFCQLSKDLITMSYGKYTEPVIEEKITKGLSMIDFESISTLKASAKMNLKSEFSEENLKELKSARPRVLTNVYNLIKEYNPSHFIDLLVPCIKHISENDSFNVELFPKDQHNGLREIYVVDIHVRVIQLFLETIARSICEFFQSETLNHPKSATSSIPKALKGCLEHNEKPFCLMKSGDASKWSQSQITSKFYIMFKTFLPKRFHAIVKDCLALWFDKKIFLPPALIESFMSANFQTSNETLNDLREGKLSTIKGKDSMFLRIKTGFMQGILHHTSSLFHTTVQEGFRQFQFKILNDVFENKKYSEYLKRLRICILQGSDDSSHSIMGDAILFRDCRELFLSLMHLKDEMSYKFGIIPSAEKTATCVPFIIEYNSQWLALGKSIQPTIKFAMVACQLPAAQSIIQRQEFYYNLLKDCLEKGCSTKTCYKIKLSQLSSHYNLLGSNNTSAFEVVSELLCNCLNPSLGFFILEPVVATAVFGFDYSFYCHTQGSLVKFLPDDYLTPLESNIPSGNTLLVNAHVSKTSWKKWKTLVESVGELNDDERAYLEENAYIYYEKSLDTYNSILKIKQKIQDFDVKQSLSSRYGITENMASFFCTFLKVCKIGNEKDSLVGWMLKCVEKNVTNLSLMFPKQKLYDEINQHISQLSEQSYLLDEEYALRGRTQITVLHNKTAANELFFDAVKYHWFDLAIDEITKESYRKLFKEYQLEFDWLKDTEKETKEFLKCSSRQLANYLRNVVGKNRTLTFYDTVAKGSSYPYLLSRIFQKNKKVQIVKRKEPSPLTNETIFSNLRILLDLPYKEPFKMVKTKELIEKLNVDRLLPKDELKFRILKNLINNETDEFAKELFKFSMENHVTWFSQAQHFNKKTRTWEGLGCLTTIISFLTIKTQIHDNVITNIIVNDLESFQENLNTYYKIVKDQKLLFDDVLDGEIRISRFGISNQIKGTKVELAPELRINLNSFKSARVAFSNGNLKIVAPMIEEQDCIFKGKQYELITLYKVETIRKAKDLEERRKADHRGYIKDDIWIDSRNYREQRDGQILGMRSKIGGVDIKVSTIMNFEMWKNPVSSSYEPLFDWGEIGTKIVNKEVLNPKTYVTEKLTKLNHNMPCDKIFECIMNENNFDKNSFLNYVSKVEFFSTVTTPIYDDCVDKDVVKEDENDMLEILNKLMCNKELLMKSIIKSHKDLNDCLLSLDDTIISSANDFSVTKFTIYGIKDTQTAFPNMLFYTFNHDMHRMIPDEEKLLDIISNGDKTKELPLEYNIFLAMFFNTTLEYFNVNTVRKLREMLLLGYTPKSSRTSRSTTRLGLYIPEDEIERKLLKKFKLSPKMPDFPFLFESEKELVKEAIQEISASAEQTKNRRVKMSFITQLVELNEDLRLLNAYEESKPKIDIEKENATAEPNEPKEQDMEKSNEGEPNKSESEESIETPQFDIPVNDNEESGSEEDNDETKGEDDEDESSDDKSQASSDISQSLSDFSQESCDISDFKIDLEFLKCQYKFEQFDKSKIICFLDVDLPNYFQRGKVTNIDDYKAAKNCIVYYESEQVNDIFSQIILWVLDDQEQFHVFSHSPITLSEDLSAISSLSLKTISSTPGGSCLFNCFTHLLGESGRSYSSSDLRKIVHDSSKNLEFLDQDEIDHRDTILNDSVWGNATDISTICQELALSVKVITNYTVMNFNFGPSFIGYIVNHDNVHFNVLE